MLNQTKVTITSGVTRKTILVDPQNSTAVSCMIANTGLEADSAGKKIVKAGTPLAGSLTARGTAFTVASESEVSSVTTSNAVGIAMHDVDVTAGTANGAILISGIVDKNKLDSDVQSKITAATEKALKMIQFIA